MYQGTGVAAKKLLAEAGSLTVETRLLGQAGAAPPPYKPKRIVKLTQGARSRSA